MSELSGDAAQGEAGMDALAGLPKIVFSRTSALPRRNMQLVPRDAVDAVREMKENDANSMRNTAASPCAARSRTLAWSTALVVVLPVITGEGGRCLEDRRPAQVTRPVADRGREEDNRCESLPSNT